MKILQFFLVLTLFFLACKKDGPAIPAEPDPVLPVIRDTSPQLARVSIAFKATVNSQTLLPVSKYYQNSSKEYFTVNKFNYYISHVKLQKADGSWYAEPNSYHLIKHVEKINQFDITGLPPADYTRISFLIGVDSLRNVSGAQSGALDPANLMFWDWNTGYIFMKLEGAFSSTVVSEGEYSIHVGGFDGPYACLQSVNLPFPQALKAVKNGTHEISLQVAVDEIFKNPKEIGLDYYYEEVVKSPKIFQDISINYRDMFSVEKVN